MSATASSLKYVDADGFRHRCQTLRQVEAGFVGLIYSVRVLYTQRRRNGQRQLSLRHLPRTYHTKTDKYNALGLCLYVCVGQIDVRHLFR